MAPPAAALDDWASLRRGLRNDPAGARRLNPTWPACATRPPWRASPRPNDWQCRALWAGVEALLLRTRSGPSPDDAPEA